MALLIKDPLDQPTNKGKGLSYASTWAIRNLGNYDDPFFWEECKMLLSRTGIPPTPEELRHANDIIKKTKTKFPTLFGHTSISKRNP